MTRFIDQIVIHCSATASGQPLERGVRGAPGYQSAVGIIDEWHKARGFNRLQQNVQAFNRSLKHIGYHYIIDLDGRCTNGRGLDEVGAHVLGHNANSIGICMIGGKERDGRYTPDQWHTLGAQVAFLQTKFGLRGTDICGHRDLSPDINKDGTVTPQEWLKTCPGFDVSAWVLAGMTPAPQHIYEAPL